MQKSVYQAVGFERGRREIPVPRSKPTVGSQRYPANKRDEHDAAVKAIPIASARRCPRQASSRASRYSPDGLGNVDASNFQRYI